MTLATEGNFINNFQIPVTSHLQGTTEFKNIPSYLFNTLVSGLNARLF